MPHDLNPLKLSTRGDLVEDLHRDLKTLGEPIPSFELEKVIFKTGTKNAVMNIQVKARLEPTREMDAKTSIGIEDFRPN
jgi:hypothetical protein